MKNHKTHIFCTNKRMGRLLYAFIMLIVSLNLMAQNNTSSPFSRFGYGELNDNVPGGYRAMGSVGLGMRSNKIINPSQPASFSVVDSTTFMMDLGMSTMWSNYGDASGHKNKANGNLEYISIQFPIWKYIGFSVGVLPYSMVGYDIQKTDTIAPHPYSVSFKGDGGITQLYGGLSFNIMNWVAVGANVYYMFGKTRTVRSQTFEEVSIANYSHSATLQVSDVRLRYGLQFFHTFGKHTIVLGGVFENKSKLNGTYLDIETTTNDTVSNSTEGFGLPMMYGAGASYCYNNRLTIAFDYSSTDWSKINYMGDALQSRNKYALGVEYIHNPDGKRYVDHIPFRFGASLADSYIPELKMPDLGISLGVGFPLRNIGTVINTTLEYGHRGSFSSSEMQENYLRLTINASISETWFFKRKL